MLQSRLKSRAMDQNKMLGQKLQLILTLIKPQDIHRWFWHASEPTLQMYMEWLFCVC